MSDLTLAIEKGLYEEPMLTETLEESGFLEPLEDTSGIEHTGWFSTVEPVFQLCDGHSNQAVADEIAKRARNGDMESAGLRGFVISESVSEVTDIFDSAVVIVKIENWWESCLPNSILDNQGDIRRYIEDSESEMSSRLQSHFDSGVFELDTHSRFGGDFGQYQFTGWEK